MTREDLMREGWQTRWWNSTKTVAVRVSWLRRKLEDDVAAPRCVTTVRGRGFRFERA